MPSKETNENFSYDSRAVANWFVRRAGKDGVFLDILKLLKLVFFAHGFATLKFKGELIDGEFQAWKYGPVAPHLYSRLRDPSGGVLVQAPVDEEVKEVASATKKLKKDAKTRRLLEGVYKKYSRVPSFKLSEETHWENTPWRRASERGGYYAPILQEDIVEYFGAHHRPSDVGL